ncbi:MAG: FHA domain-containing protein [Bacteroidaceae bacterium]|nr:FHA domain-containing protein [Bacteroidaceae bacterium]
MSQNKTVIQGLEPADGQTRPAYGGGGNTFYSRSEAGPGRPRGTVVQGMTDNYHQPQQPQQPQQQNPQYAPRPAGARGMANAKPVVGFLYSVSRTAAGEFWPLHIGQNTIGQLPTCNIVLPEGTVSGEHAVLVVRKMKNPEKVIASISDARSTNGTMLNGVSLGFAAEECHNGDIITIGDNYELLLLLVDAASLGLAVSDSFIPVAVEEEEEEEEFDPFAGGKTRPGGSAFDGPIPPPFGGYTSGGTVGLDGSAGSNKGGTVGM